MVALNSASSTYHALKGMYWRDDGGRLLAVEGRYAEQIRSKWSDIYENTLQTPKVIDSRAEQTILTASKKTLTYQANCSCLCESAAEYNHPHIVKIQEFTHPKTGLIKGVIICQTSVEHADAFRSWLTTYFLLESEFMPLSTPEDVNDGYALKVANDVTDLFDRSLRNIPSVDEWITKDGRSYFRNRVFGYVQQNLPIQFALPAFPCKSSNPRKVGGRQPDRAEYLALDVLRNFVAEVKNRYPIGATLWIVSDGHVFADCSKCAKADSYPL